MKRPFVLMGAGALLGAAVFCLLFPSVNGMAAAAALFALFFLLFALFRKRTAALFLLSALLVLFCGIFRTAAIAKPARALAGETVSVKGSVRQVYPTGFIVEGETDGGQPISLIVWCQREMVPDRLQRFSGRVELSHISSTDRFDSEGYYHSRGIFLQGQWLQGSFSDPEKPLLSDLPLRWSDALCQRICTILPQKYAGFLCAAVLGQRQYLLDGQYETLQNIGVSHLLAVSGIHLNLLTSLLGWFLPRRKPRLSAAVTIGFLLFYLCLTGMNPSVVRAGIMLILSRMAGIFAREKDSANSLFFALWLMLIGNPFLLASVAFQYSAVCSFGVEILSPLLEKKLCRPLPDKLHPAAKALSVSLCAYPGAAALTLFHEKRLIWMTVPANLLLSPLFSLLLTLFAGLTVCAFLPVFSPLLAALIRPVADLFFFLTEQLSELGGNGIYLPGTAPKIVLLIIIFTSIYTICADFTAIRPLIVTAALLFCCTSICTQAVMTRSQIAGTAAAFGNSLLTVLCKDGHGIVIGHLSSVSQVKQTAQYLRENRVRTVDLLVLLPCGGDPRVSLRELTGAFPVSLIALSDGDNQTTQFLESCENIPTCPYENSGISFWDGCELHLFPNGSAQLLAGGKNLLILPADCAILKEEALAADLLITAADMPPAVDAACVLAANHFWGEQEQNPNAFLLSYAVGKDFAIPIN